MTIKKGTSTIATTGSTTWGGLEGTLSDQTDLQNALDAKASTLSPAFSGVPTAPTAQEGTNTTQIATTAFVKNAVDNIDALPDQTDMAGKYLATDGVNAFWKSPAGLPLLSFIWSDHLLNDASFLRADTWSWHDGTIYQAAYQALADAQSTGTQSSETIGSYTIQFTRATNGWKIVSEANAGTVEDIYQESGVAWYYVLDTANTQFKLPRAKHNKYAETLGVVGNGMALGFDTGITSPAGYEHLGLRIGDGNQSSLLTATTGNYGATVGAASSGSGTSKGLVGGITTDAAKSGIIAQQTQDTDQYKYLYFYVGNTVRNQTEIDVGEITEALDGKLDQDLSNASVGFKRRVSDYSAPSDQYIDYTFPSTNGDTETAPANGWFVFQSGVSAGGYLGLRNLTNGISFEVRYSSATNGRTFVPCATGDTIEVGFEQLVSSNQLFRFVYAEGEI